MRLPENGLDNYLDDVERAVIREALSQTQGNKKRAAELLKLNRTTLVAKCQRLGFPDRTSAAEIERIESARAEKRAADAVDQAWDRSSPR